MLVGCFTIVKPLSEPMMEYRQTCNIRRNNSQNLNVSYLVLLLYLSNLLKPGVKSRLHV